MVHDSISSQWYLIHIVLFQANFRNLQTIFIFSSGEITAMKITKFGTNTVYFRRFKRVANPFTITGQRHFQVELINFGCMIANDLSDTEEMASVNVILRKCFVLPNSSGDGLLLIRMLHNL